MGGITNRMTLLEACFEPRRDAVDELGGTSPNVCLNTSNFEVAQHLRQSDEVTEVCECQHREELAATSEASVMLTVLSEASCRGGGQLHPFSPPEGPSSKDEHEQIATVYERAVHGHDHGPPHGNESEHEVHCQSFLHGAR